VSPAVRRADPTTFDPKALYQVEEGRESILDLLRRFSEAGWMREGISRLADMHLKVGQPVRYREDGDLVPLAGAEPLTQELIEGLVFPLLRLDQIKQLRARPPRDVDAAFHLDGEQGMNFRVNVFHDRDGMAAVVRSLSQTVPTPIALGFPDDEVLEHILTLRQGLVVVTGVTGSGKSTTIASILSELNRRSSLRVITLEDPVEFVLKDERCVISQREIGRHVTDFRAGLRSALREDPDVILVGEIRDTETAALALSAAETGHLVFTTLHTRDARGAVTRLVDLFPAERGKEVMSQLSFSLAYVVAQKLVPRKEGLGRVGAFEILKNIPSIANLIRMGNWHQIQATMQLQGKEHMITLERHLSQLVARGLITREAALAAANDPAQVQVGPGSSTAPAGVA
jgi:twitching motility protein PilT